MSTAKVVLGVVAGAATGALLGFSTIFIQKNACQQSDLWKIMQPI